MPPCVVYEDEDLLVVNKPPGWNTHAPAPYAGEGIYDWLRHREPRWAGLAIIHRLDKDTSGLLVFGKTPRANQALTAQFAGRVVEKRYRLVTDRPVADDEFVATAPIVRAGERYRTAPEDARALPAETRFRVVERAAGHVVLDAEPLTGRTHQIRVHAAALGLPILGDVLYGGAPAARLHLHAAGLAFRHPATDEPLSLEAPADFTTPPGAQLRAACIDPAATNAFRLAHGAADGEPGVYRDRLGDFELREVESLPAAAVPASSGTAAGIYARARRTDPGAVSAAEAAPVHVAGSAAPSRLVVRENGVAFELGLAEGYSTGLFLDQRDNRRRLLTGHVAAGFPLYAAATGAPPEVLNCFAYTCGFSVCAALGGARTTSIDLSRRYLDWGRQNFRHNGLDPAAHDFIYGDAGQWLQRLARKGRSFAVVLLDPPTFSRSPAGVFRAEADYGELVARALPLLAPGGVLFASTNAARLAPETFEATVRAAVAAAGRRVTQAHYVPQPPDFPVSRDEPAYLKTLWLRVAG